MQTFSSLRIAIVQALIALFPLLLAAGAQSAGLPDYVLRDYLGKEWMSERVTYPVAPGEANALRKGARLLDGAGTEVPWQVHSDGAHLSFQASIPKFKEAVYRFEPGPPVAKSDLSATADGQFVELRNAKTGVRLNKALNEGAGPIVAWRLGSGAWSGASRFEAAGEVESYDVRLAESGPVFASATAMVRFRDGGTWSLTVELEAGEPLFRVREVFDCSGRAGQFSLVLNAGFDPDWLLYRAAGAFDHPGGRTTLGKLVDSDIPEGEASLFLLEPWVHWQYSLNRGTWFTLLDMKDVDTLFMGTGDSSCWVNPRIPEEERAPAQALLRRSKDGSIMIGFEIKRGEREYFLGSLPVADVRTDLYGAPPPAVGQEETDLLDEMADETEKTIRASLKKKKRLLDGVPDNRLYRAPLPQQVLMRHSDYPLDRVKDMVLEWDDLGEPRVHPRLLVGPKQLTALRARCEVNETSLKNLRSKVVNSFHLDDLVPAYLATGDAELEQRLVDGAVSMVQENTDSFLNLRADNMSVGVAPHHRRLVSVVNLVDAILSSERLSPEQRRNLRGQLAFLGYLYHSPAYWSPERGYGAMFVNMHTTVASIQCAIAGALPDHPECEAWMNKGMDYMRRKQAETWIDEEGRWSGNNVEAPHYALAYDNVLAAMIKAERIGLGPDLYGPAMIRMGEWFAKISTPRDPRFLNLRHLPPIGNTYKFEPSGIFGILAGVYRKHDPKFSAEMQWMQAEQGNQLSPGVGGFFGDLAGYRRIIMDPALPARQPDYRSEWFRGAGAVLRSSYATEDEMMLYMIAGPGAVPSRHYDKDQGAITFWGRGIPISDDFGYTGCAPAEDQSLLVTSAAGGIMEVEALEEGGVFDYLQGRQSGWLRQIMLVKCPKGMDAPEYFVIHDSLAAPAEATWLLWLTAEPVRMGDGETLIVEPLKQGKKSPVDLMLEAVPAGGGSEILEGMEMTAQDKSFSVGVGDGKILVNGHKDRQTDIIFAALPPGAEIQTELKTRAPAGVDGTGRYLGRVPNSQVGVILRSKSFSSLLTLVFTRLKTGETPKVTAIAGGRGFRIEHARGTDTVFLSEQPLAYEADGVVFDGAVGAIRAIGGKVARQVRDP